MKKMSILVALALTLSVTTASAMHKEPHCNSDKVECKKMKPLTDDQKQAIQEFKVEMKEYKNSEIIPSLTEWKKQLDAAMTPEDLSKLNSLRLRADEFRGKLVSSMKDMKNGNKQAMKEMFKDSKENMRTIMEELKPFAEKYKGTIENLMETAKPKMEEWREDVMEIHKETTKESFPNDGKECDMSIMKHHKMRSEMNPMGNIGRRHFGRPAMFMLWNGQSDLFDTNEESIVSSAGNGNVSQSGFTLKQNTPNPSAATTSFSFVVDKPSTVSMKLYDVNGTEVLTIVDNVSYQAGEYTVNADVRNLPIGTYFYRLTSGGISLQKTMSVTR